MLVAATSRKEREREKNLISRLSLLLLFLLLFHLEIGEHKFLYAKRGAAAFSNCYSRNAADSSSKGKGNATAHKFIGFPEFIFLKSPPAGRDPRRRRGRGEDGQTERRRQHMEGYFVVVFVV